MDVVPELVRPPGVGLALGAMGSTPRFSIYHNPAYRDLYEGDQPSRGSAVPAAASQHSSAEGSDTRRGPLEGPPSVCVSTQLDDLQLYGDGALLGYTLLGPSERHTGGARRATGTARQHACWAHDPSCSSATAHPSATKP